MTRGRIFLIVNERQSLLVAPSSSSSDILPRRHIQRSAISQLHAEYSHFSRDPLIRHTILYRKHLFIALKLTVPNFRLLNSSLELCCVRAKICFFDAFSTSSTSAVEPFTFECSWASAKLSQTFLRRDIVQVHFRTEPHKMNASWWSEMKFDGNYVWLCRFRNVFTSYWLCRMLRQLFLLNDAIGRFCRFDDWVMSDGIVNWLNGEKQIMRNERRGFEMTRAAYRRTQLWTKVGCWRNKRSDRRNNSIAI